MADTPWGEPFQRLVLALGLRGDLFRKFPAALTPAIFGGASQTQTPQQRIAKILNTYWETYQSRPPVEVIDELVRQEVDRLGDAEKQAVANEWVWTAETELPEDPKSVYDQVQLWLDYRTIETALFKAGDTLRPTAESVRAVRESLLVAADAQRPGEGDRETFFDYIATSEDRLRQWEEGTEQGEPIPTGLPALDAALQGGPTRKEFICFLAPPKGAKTASLLRVGLGAARRGFGVYVVTYEMQAMRMLLRYDRMVSRQNRDELRASRDILKKALWAMQMVGTQLYVEEQPPQKAGSVERVARRIERIRREGGKVDVVVMDYLNIMASVKPEKEKRHELSRVARDMSSLAKEYNVLVWSAALTNRAAVRKRIVRKDDIAEVYEAIAVIDAGIAICATKIMLDNNLRRYWVAAGREVADETLAGDYNVDFSRQTIDPADTAEVDRMLDLESEQLRSRRRVASEDQG